MTINLDFSEPALFIASYAIPPLIAPSPTTQITLFFFFIKSLAIAIPKPEDIAVEA